MAGSSLLDGFPEVAADPRRVPGREVGSTSTHRNMGQCLCCLGDREGDRDPILDAEARARAAEAAQNRQESYANSAAGKREAKARARDAAASRGGGLSADAHQQRINDIIN